MGLTTGVSVFRVNGYSLAVATSFSADRTGHVYHSGVEPDIEIIEGDNFIDLLQDTKVAEAVKFFKQK